MSVCYLWDNRGLYLSYLGDVTVVDQHSLSFRVLPKKAFSDPSDQLAPARTHLENIVCDNIKGIFFLLNREVRFGNQGNENRHTEEALWNTSSSDS